MNPRVWSWFTARFGSPTQVQREAFPAILGGRDVLVTSPTGTGKTLSAFLGIISRLADLAEKGRLEDRVYCVYVAPLKALATDIEVNLRGPLEEMARGGSEAARRIRVGVRTGDTPQSERRAMTARPPHIFITTPESFCLSVASPVSGLAFDSASFLVVDELHDLMQSRRGALMALFVELLESRSGRLQRIGISATLSDSAAAGRFLVGSGRELPTVCRGQRKGASLSLVRPREDLLTTPLDRTLSLAAEDCVAIAEREGTTIVFTNTRSDAEALGQEIARLRGAPTAVHHGSVAEEERRRIEAGLRDGKVGLAVCSSSLELGIDIGGVGAVVVFGSPGALSRTVQRVGRSGHRAGEASKGYLVPRDLADLLEMGAILEGHSEGLLEPIDPPEVGPDLVMQFIVGASTRGPAKLDEIAAMARRAGCAWADERSVALLAETLNMGQQGRLVESSEGLVRATGRGRMVLFQNVGAVTNAPSVRVRDSAGSSVGTLSPGFAAELARGEVIALGGGMYTVLSVGERDVVVEHSPARFPTVPAWGGEGLARSGLVRDMARRALGPDATGSAAPELASWREEYRSRGLGAPGEMELHLQTLSGEGGEWTLLTGVLDRRTWAAFARLMADAGACGEGAAAFDDGLVVPGRLDLRKMRRKAGSAPPAMDAGHVRTVRTALASRALLSPETVGEREIAFSARSRRAWSIFEGLPASHPLRLEEARILAEESVRLSEARRLWDGIVSGRVRVRRVPDPPLPLSRALLARGARELLTLPRMLAMEFAHALGIDGMLAGDAGAEAFMARAWEGRTGSALVSARGREGWRRLRRSRLFLHPDLPMTGSRSAENAILECARLGLPSDAIAGDGALEGALEALRRQGAVAVARVGGLSRLALADDVARAAGADIGLWQAARARGALALAPAASFSELLARYPLVRDEASARARGVAGAPDGRLHLRGRYSGGRLAWVARADIPALVSLYGAREPEVDLSRLPRDAEFDALAFRQATGLEPRDTAEAIAALESCGRIERLPEKSGRTILYRLAGRRREGDWRPLLTRLVESLGAATPSELSASLNIEPARAREALDGLAAAGRIARVRVGMSGASYFAGLGFLEHARGMRVALDGSVGCVPSRDPAVLWDAGEPSQAVLLRDLLPSGSVLLEPSPYLGHARAKSLPAGVPPGELAETLADVSAVMSGRRARVFSVEAGPKSGGWRRHGRFSVAGASTMRLGPEEAVAIVLSSQRLSVDRRLDDAEAAFAFLGYAGSDLHLAARARRGKPLAALARGGSAVRARGPSGGVGAVSRRLLPTYAKALDATLSDAAVRLLAALTDSPFARPEALARDALLSEEAADAAGEELAAALRCWRSPEGRLLPVDDAGMTRAGAVAEVVAAEIARDGLARAEELAALHQRVADERSLSDALDSLWDAGRVEPAFAVADRDSLHWKPSGGLPKPATGTSVVPPDDRAWPVLAALLPEPPEAGAFLVFEGGRLLGSFRAAVSQRRLVPSSVDGGQAVAAAGRELAHRAGLAWGREIPQTEDWEVLDWWERTRGLGKERIDFG